MKICVIGAGWYGCYVTEKLLEYGIKVTLLDKEDDIFKGSSSNNQNRLHLGFHYPRCDITSTKCQKYFDKFVEKYNKLIEDVDNNIYCIEKNSNVKYKDYIEKFKNFDLLDNKDLIGIEGKLLRVNEKYINFKKTRKYFLKILESNNLDLILNYTVKSMVNYQNKVIINNELIFDKVINCTYNHIQDKNSVIYEKCITLLYNKVKNVFFDSLTVMDGNYFSIYKYTEDLFSVTSVKYTPVCKGSLECVSKYEIENLSSIIQKIEKQVIDVYPKFKESFVYRDYYISYKCKNITENDSRDINISIDSNIMNIWCGKISLVFEVDEKLIEFIK